MEKIKDKYQDLPTTQKARPRPGIGPRGHGIHIESAKNFKKALKKLINYLGPQIVIVILSSIFILFSVILRVVAPALIGNAIKNYLELAQNLRNFIEQVILILIIYIAAWAAGALSNVLVTRIANIVVFRLRNEAFIHIQSLSMSYMDRQGIGDIISRLTNDIQMISHTFSNGFINLISGLFSIVGIMVAMIILNIQLTLIILAIVPIMIIITGIIGKRVRQAFRENQKQVGILSANITESVTAVKVIKTFNREKQEFNKFEKLNERARKIGVKAEVTSYLLMPVMQFISSLIIMFMVGIGGALVLHYRAIFSIGLLTTFIIYSRQFFQPLRQMSQVYNILQSGMAGVERVFEVLQTKPEITNKENAVLLNETKGNIEFSDVSFGYTRDKVVLENINLKVKKGEVIAIVGPTGAGKTTLVNLLCRFYDVDKGTIYLDKQDIRDIEIGSFRKQMGVVLQEPFFFAVSIKENLKYGNPQATDEQIIKAATITNAEAFIHKLPHDYDTILAERGMNLSQGERQLLAITRVIIANPRILILDEAMSNIDSLSEMYIQKGLLELMKGRTSFIIAHRLSTIKNADKVIVIHNHKIIEQGTHSQLMKKGGFYSNLYAMQLTKVDVTEDMLD